MARDFAPPRWLRNPHLQSALASSRLRRLFGGRRRGALAARSRPQLLDCGDGVRLLGYHTPAPEGVEPLGLVVLLHGWEGSVDSSYLLRTGDRLHAAGFELFRLNFRDHGDTHHLNEDLFHSNRIDEVVGAVADVQRRFPARPLLIGGFSLGGNFALRVALRAPAAGIELRHVVAVCPVISPASGLCAIESAPWFYESYFLAKWRGSLRRKQALYPQRYDFDGRAMRQGLRGLTRLLVERHTDFGTLERYLDGYSVAGDRLAGLQVPGSILTAADDPIIPVEDFHALQLPAHVRLDVAPFGGHCGFIAGAALDSYADHYVVAKLLDAVGAGDGAGAQATIAPQSES